MEAQQYERFGKTLTVEELTQQLQEAKRRWRRLKQPQQQEYARKVGIIQQFLFRADSLQNKERENAIKALKVKSAQTFYNYIERCQLQSHLFPHEDLAYALVKLAGPPRVRLFSAEQELLIIGAYLFYGWEVELPNGKVRTSRDRVDPEFIQQMITHAYPNLEVTVQQVSYFIKKQQEEYHILFALGRRGFDEVFRMYVPKMPNMVFEPHIRWQSDARILPIIVIMDNGKQGQARRVWKCTVSLVIIIDDFTQCILNWCLVPRKIEDEIDPEKLRGADFTNYHVRILMAGAMVDFQARPHLWYTDRGSQFMAIVDFIRWLTPTNDDQRIIPIKGFPGHPWSRGKVELVQKLVNDCLHKLSGFVHNENDRQEWKRATDKTDIKFDDLQSVVAAYVQTWNDTLIQGQSSRINVVRHGKYTPRPAPSEQRLAVFAASDVWGEVKVEDTGIPIRGTYYKPAAFSTKEDYRRFMDVVGKYVQYAEIPQLSGNAMLANITENNWELVIPSDKQPASGTRRSKNQWGAIGDEQTRLREYIQRFTQLSERLFGEMPRTQAIGNAPSFASPKNRTPSEKPSDSINTSDVPETAMPTQQSNLQQPVQINVQPDVQNTTAPDRNRSTKRSQVMSQPTSEPEIVIPSRSAALEMARQRRSQMKADTEQK